MAELIAKSPLSGQGAATHGALTLVELALGRVTSLAPFVGTNAKLRAALTSAGLGWPAPNRVVTGAAVRVVWTGREQAFIFGDPPDGLSDHAALTDQGDGWVGLLLTGDGAADALVRLVPLDLAKMQQGECARAPLGHMSALLIRVEEGFEILVFRSMARTAWHEIETAMQAMAARKLAGG